MKRATTTSHLVTAGIVLLAMTFFVNAQAGDPIVTPFGESGMTCESISASPSDALDAFSSLTKHGTLSGIAHYRGGNITYTIAGPDAAATISYEEGTSGELIMTIVVTGFGYATMVLNDGVVTTMEDKIANCDGLRDSEFLGAAREIASNYPFIVNDPNINDPDSGIILTSQVFELILRPLVSVPGMLGCDSEVVDPANGLCVLEVTWGECVYCCDEDAYWDSVITETAAIVALAAIGNPWLAAPAGALGIMTGTPNDCIRKVCTGKPGDPQPHGCADGQGICMFACPQQNGIPGSTGDCPSHAVCCATTY